MRSGQTPQRLRMVASRGIELPTRELFGLVALFLVSLTAGCARATAPAPAAPTSSLQPIASIREIMEAETDPAADAVWDSVRITITTAGEEDKQPRTEKEWNAVRVSALILVESTNLLLMQGRHIVKPDFHVPAGEADPRILQQRLDSNRAAFDGFAQALRDVGLKTLAAIDAKDSDRLFQLGGEIDQACEACHVVFWYPPDLVKN
jgi:hypothetical protein